MPRDLTKKTLTAAAISAAVLLGAGLSGCKSNMSTPELLVEAQQYQRLGDNKAALIQLKNAVAQSPEDGEARLRLGTLHFEMGDMVSADKELRKAASLGTQQAVTLPLLGKAMQAQGQFQQILDEITPEVAKGSAALLTLRADAYLALGKRAEAKQTYEQALALAPTTGDALVGLSRLAVVQRDMDSAQRYLDEATAKDPKNAEVWMFKGAMLRAQNKPDDALAAFDKALAIKPDHRMAHVEKAYIEIAQGKFPAAKASVDAARKNAPGSLVIHYAQAMLDFTQGKFAAAQESLQAVLKNAPDHLPSILLAGAVELNLGATQQAEQHLRKYLAADPNNIYARKLLAQTLLKSSQPANAAEALAPALKQPTQDAQLLALAGESYMQARDFDKATAYFEQATVLAPQAAVLHASLGMSRLNQGDHERAVAELRRATELDPKSTGAAFALVQAELNLKRHDKALAAIEAIEKQQPDNAQVQNVKGGVYLSRGDTAAARAAFEKALALQPSFFTAVTNLAQLDIGENKPDAARKRFDAFLARDPKNFGAMSALADLAMMQGKPDEATSWLEKASNANPDAVAPALKLGLHYLRTRQPQKALTLARKSHTAHPANPDVIDLLGQAQLASNDQGGALETYSKLVNVLPKSALAHMRVARVHAMMKNDAAAADSLRRAAELEPGLVEARFAQIELAVHRGKPGEAIAVARGMQKQARHAHLGYIMEGDVHLSQKQAAQALGAYQKAYAQRQTPQLLIKIAEVMKQMGKSKEAQPLLAQWQKAHPGEPIVAMYVAESHLANKQYKPAITILQDILKRSPDNPVALNNLAWAYQQDKDPRALATAEQAMKVTANSPAVMDTLGWLLVEQGDTQRGVELLKKASALAPQAAEIRYHLAYGLSKAGDKEGARRELDKLLSQKQPFAQLDEARSLRNTL